MESKIRRAQGRRHISSKDSKDSSKSAIDETIRITAKMATYAILELLEKDIGNYPELLELAKRDLAPICEHKITKSFTIGSKKYEMSLEVVDKSTVFSFEGVPEEYLENIRKHVSETILLTFATFNEQIAKLEFAKVARCLQDQDGNFAFPKQIQTQTLHGASFDAFETMFLKENGGLYFLPESPWCIDAVLNITDI